MKARVREVEKLEEFFDFVSMYSEEIFVMLYAISSVFNHAYCSCESRFYYLGGVVVSF